MIVNRANLDTAFRGFRAVFKEGFEAAPANIDKVAMRTSSGTSEEEYAWLDAVTVTPKIDTGPIERAIEMMRLLNGAVRGGGASSSFMDNAAPAGRARTDGPNGRQSSVTNHNNFNVTGYSPAVVARRIAREEARAAREAQFGALHDLGSLA